MLIQHAEARGPAPKLSGHLVDALRRLGCSVVTHHWGQHRPDESLLEKLIQRSRDVLSVRRALQHQTFDVAVVNTAHDWRTLLRDITVVAAIRRRCRPVVLQFHGSLAETLVRPGNRALKLFTAALLALVDGVMVLSKEEERYWMAFRRTPPVFTVKNPYVSAFPASTPQMSSSSSRSRDRMLFVGRLIAAKGIFELVDALADVISHTHCELVMVGEGPQEAELRDRIHRLGVEPYVTLTGYLKGQELIDQYRDASIFVLPSWREGFPTVLSEAMDAGLPIVTSRIYGAADHLIDGRNALLVRPRCVRDLSSAISRLLRDSDLRLRMAINNRETIAMFEPRVVATEYLRVLRLVVQPS